MGNASALFYSDARQTLHGRVTPTTEQREFLQEKWNSLAESLKLNLFEKHGFPISTWIQGSYKYGTLIRPIHPDDDYDVDIGVYFGWQRSHANAPTPLQLRDWVQQELLDYKKSTPGILDVENPAKERCSRVLYEDKFHIDTPVYHLDPAGDRRRLACLSGQWEESDPKAIYKWFRNIFKDPFDGGKGEQARRIIRYLKGWAAVAFTTAAQARPSSILLTVLVSEALSVEYGRRFLSMDDEVALIAVIRRIQTRILSNSVVSNPIAKTENLNRICEPFWNGFLARLQSLRDAADRAAVAENEAAGALAWSEVFSFLMPLPEVSEIQVIDGESERSLMSVPDVEVRILRESRRTEIAKHLNSVPAIAQGHVLEFSIMNPHALPEFPTIEWTLRYCGDGQNMDGALGRRETGVAMISATALPVREGTYSMDCVVRVSGSVYAVRRIPFYVGEPNLTASPATYLRSGAAKVIRRSLS